MCLLVMLALLVDTTVGQQLACRMLPADSTTGPRTRLEASGLFGDIEVHVTMDSRTRSGSASLRSNAGGRSNHTEARRGADDLLRRMNHPKDHCGALMRRIAEYMTLIPDGMDLPGTTLELVGRDDDRRTAPGGRRKLTSYDDDGTVCLRRGTRELAYFRDRNGKEYSQSQEVGGRDCTGRCGFGCNWFDDDYMRDCFDHDVCLIRLGGPSVIGNLDCSEELLHAFDDYIVTYINYC